jgi:hypothetical protein
MFDSVKFSYDDLFWGLDLHSKHLNKKFVNTMEIMSRNYGKSIFSMSGSRSDAKLIYSMLQHEKFGKDEILRAHRMRTILRIIDLDKPVLLIEDTSGINYSSQKHKRDNGYISNHGKGVLLHSCIATSLDGILLGVMNQIAYNREEAHDNSLSKEQKKKRPIEEKESYRWIQSFQNCHADMPDYIKTITVCDREGDFYEFISEIDSNDRSFLIRIAQNRVSMDNEKIMNAVSMQEVLKTIQITVPRNSHKNLPERKTNVEIRVKQCDIKRPAILNKNQELPKSISAYIIHVKEVNSPAGVEPIEWFLMTNDEINVDNVLDYIKYYKQRWLIERFHYVLKSGCNVEKIQARTMDVTVSIITMYSIIAVLIMNMTYQARINPELPCSEYFEEEEWKALYCFANKTNKPPDKVYNIQDAVKYLSWLGGTKTAPSDGPPGLKKIWKGLENFYMIYEYSKVFFSKMGQV